ncbi:MAG: hypothetical protein ACREMJ_02130, partial [Gemmatimonadales bacterium]
GELLGVAHLPDPVTPPADLSSARRVLLALSAVAVGMAIAGAVLFVRYTEEVAPDPGRIAVAPFDVMVERPGLGAARVRLALALTRAFDASGSHTAVPQAEVARRWQARATSLIAAIELGRRTGATFAVYGRVDPGPGDSLLVRAALLNAPDATGLFEVQTTVAADGLDRAADNIAAIILRRLREPQP